MKPEEVLDLIKTRRSVRQYRDEPVDQALIEQILEAGRWAPSGRKNEPWRFVVVREPVLKKKIGGHTKYHAFIENAPVIIPVFIHKPSMYAPLKDHQSIGACLQNMLLMAHGLGLGAVWLGEILKQADGVRDTLGLDEDLELMAVIALGWPQGKAVSDRLDMSSLLLAVHDA